MRPRRRRLQPFNGAGTRASRRTRLSLAFVFATVFAPATSRPAAAGCVPFATPPALASGISAADDLHLVDLDRDGDLDVVVTGQDTTPNTLWLENLGGGSWTAHTIPDLGKAIDSALADVDGDGDVDLVTTVNSGGILAWHENDGSGGGWTGHTVVAGSPFLSTWATAAGDLDGDGDVDLLLAESAEPGGVVWAENVAGDGSSWSLHSIGTPDYLGSITVVDLDRDGDLDLVHSTSSYGTSWVENTAGDGSSWSVHSVGALDDARVADVDGDGDPDLVSAFAGAFVGAENTAGDASAWATHTLATGLGPVRWFGVADLDGDGDLDAVVTAYSSGVGDLAAGGIGGPAGAVTWLENTQGDASDWASHRVDDAAVERTAGVLGDVDGDGDTDVVTTDETNDLVRLLDNDLLKGSALFDPPVTVGSTASGPYAVLAADVDRDGDLDLVTSTRHVDEIAWRENVAGDGSSWARHTMTTAADYPNELALGDLDRDGDLDVLVASRQDGSFRWVEHLAPGDASAWTAHLIATVGEVATLDTEAWNIAAADLDGDGDLDALVSLYKDDALFWLENDGAGAGWTPHTLATGFDGAWFVTSADVDADGDVDAVAGRRGVTGEFAWFENDGAGAGWTAHSIRPGGDDSREIVPVDVDGDGDLDFVSADAGLDVFEWHENLGGGTSWGLHTIASGLYAARSVQAADLDGDGDPDVAATTTFDDSTWWYENDGTGGTWTAVRITELTDYAFKVAAADLDGDGDVDLAVSSDGDDRVSWLQNRGTRIFSDGFDSDLPLSANLGCWSTSVP